MNRNRDDDTKKHKQELIKLFLKHKLEKEYQFTKLNELKVNQKWRAILRKSKSLNLHKEIEEMNHCFRDVLNHKDVMIDILQREHEEADRNHSLVARQHLISMNKLVESKVHRANLSQDDFSIKLNFMMEKLNTQKEILEQRQTGDLNNVEDIRQGLELQHLDKETKIVNRYIQMEEELLEMDRKDKNEVRINMELQLNQIWAELQSVLKEYLLNTKDNRETYEVMKERNTKCLEDIHDQRMTIKNLNDTIEALRQTISETETKYTETAEFLKKEKGRMQNYSKELKMQLRKTKTSEQNKLKKLVVESENSVAHLNAIYEQGSSAMKLHTQCEKIERSNWMNDDDDEESDHNKFHQSENVKYFQSVVNAMAFFDTDDEQQSKFEYFWFNFNSHVGRNKTLEHEITRLSLRNQELQLDLKKKIYGIESTEFHDEKSTHLKIQPNQPEKTSELL